MDNIKSFIRDLNLNFVTNKDSVKIDISKRFNNRFIEYFLPNRKLIKYISKIGGVLTGSRALKCYKINDKPIFVRHTNDWDFIVTLEMAYKICDKFNINEIPISGDVISITNHLLRIHPAYSSSYRIGPVDIHLIIKDELPEYLTINKMKLSNFIYIVNEKYKIIESFNTGSMITRINSEEKEKHIEDLKQFIIKYNTSQIK